MPIIFHQEAKQFHIYNDEISYIINILANNQLGNLYYGKKLKDRPSFSYLFQSEDRSLAANVFEDEPFLSLQDVKQEYPSYGSTDFKYPSFEIKQKDGSKITNFEYQSHQIYQGKKKLDGLPATYVEKQSEVTTLEITLCDAVINTTLILSYSLFENLPTITRHAKFIHQGKEDITLNRGMSLSLDLPDKEYSMIHLAGSWSRERHVTERKLYPGVQSIYSMTGSSSAEHNPFIALKRPNTDQFQGEVYGFSLIYSGNYLGQVEVDTHDKTRILMGIHPDTFEWTLREGESFQTPEAVMVYSDRGLNKMSQTFHQLYRTRLARGYWRDKARPVLVNNWEATEMEFTEEQVLNIAKAGKNLGAELFVLDDGWFGDRDHDKAGLGDWYVTNFDKLPDGIIGLAEKIEEIGLKFGLWFEPEMVNKNSDLYREHPDWIIATPDRSESPARNQHVLDFSREEVVDYIYNLMEKVLSEAKISYVKWDMNRYITEYFSLGRSAEEQGKNFHKYILGLYSLYERLIEKFPYVLFESCASGGARFDPGILHYAPQTWTSDNTDAIERLKIQYGTSYVYPLSSMGAHVSAVPNQQVGRTTPLETRANIAFFGAFGYEMDLNTLTEAEQELVKEQIAFYKANRKLIMKGNYYRLTNPFEEDLGSWLIVSKDKQEAIAGYYKILNTANDGWKRFRLVGLEPNTMYMTNDDRDQIYSGSELMYAGIVLHKDQLVNKGSDFSSAIFHLKAT